MEPETAPPHEPPGFGEHPSSDLAAAWGILPGYHDISGRWVVPEPEAVSRVLALMGADGPSPPPSPVRLVRVGTHTPLDEPHEVLTEDGARLPAEQALPAGLAPGYHTLTRLSDGASWRLIVSPGSCYLPDHLRGWGWAVQMYGVRSRASWGIGDLADLRELARCSSEAGASVLLLNPLHAPLPRTPQEPSPYYPSSRRFRNPLYLRLEEVPAAARLGDRLASLAEAGHRLNAVRDIDRDRVFQLKMAGLEELFSDFEGSAEFDRYCASAGRSLEDYATFCAIAETELLSWHSWPPELRHPTRPGVARFREAHRSRVRFHQWLQWLIDLQLRDGAQAIGLIHDLAIGARPDGADTWLWQDQFAHGASVGAPPDPFNAAGQDWGLPPFDPWKLRAAAYDPFVETIRSALSDGAGLRLDHVMGLFRLFWIPEGAGPAGGVYVRYPYQDLLDILALESSRAGAFVVGEDLGTVEDVVREELAARRIMSYHLLWFEDRHPSAYRHDAMAALTTHDLPTLAGVWEGPDSDPVILERLHHFGGAEPGATTELAAEAAHRALAGSASRLVTVTLEDVLGVVERPNLPGTTTERANWSLALPAGLEEICQDPRTRRLAELLRR